MENNILTVSAYVLTFPPLPQAKEKAAIFLSLEALKNLAYPPRQTKRNYNSSTVDWM